MSRREAPSSHRDLLIEAKQQQAANLQAALQASSQLVKSVGAIIRVNSSNSAGCAAVLDKITTIHELDQEIDRQLKQDFVASYGSLMSAKKTLARSVKSSRRALGMDPESSSSYVDTLQHKVELLDQDLRILEETFRSIEANRGNS